MARGEGTLTLIFHAGTAEEFRQQIVGYLEGQIVLEENALGRFSAKKEQQCHEARRDLLIELSDRLKEAELKGKES